MGFGIKAQAGEWALITGATSGIGAEYACQLAALGYNLILHGRREEKLQLQAGELRSTARIEVRYVTAELTSEEGISDLIRMAAGQPGLRILVNNAGYGEPGLAHERSVDSMTDMLRVHNEAVVRVTHAALPQMVAAGRGAVINVSSVAAFLPGRGNVMYISTKAFLNAFSRSLAADLRDTGVVVQSLCPGFTHTSFHDPGRAAHLDKSRIPAWLWMEAGDVVAISLTRLGRGRVIVIPGIVNRIFAWIGGHEWLYEMVTRNVRRK